MTARLPFSDSRLMSLSLSEFKASIAKLGPHRTIGEIPVFDIAGGTVAVRYEPAPPKVFGGLLSLPQAHIKLVFDGVEERDRTAFIDRFDIAFQRGGG